MRHCTTAILLILTLALHAAERDPAQAAVVDLITSQVVASEAVWDKNGNVVKLAISNHNGTPRGRAGNQDAPGVDPEDFARVLELKHLQAIAIERQPLPDASYDLLGQLTHLRDVRLQYLNFRTFENCGASAAAALFINDLPLPLEVLELKHCFHIDGDIMAQLKPQPELIKLELDTNYAGSSATDFIVQCPKVQNLQLHRTSMSNSDLQRVIRALPDLRFLEVRPTSNADPITGASLAAFEGHQKIEAITGSMNWFEMPWEGGLEVLSRLPTLRYFAIDASKVDDWTLDHPSLQALHAARPDIRIEIQRDHIGGGEDFQPVPKDQPWNWDNGVNTHG